MRQLTILSVGCPNSLSPEGKDGGSAIKRSAILQKLYLLQNAACHQPLPTSHWRQGGRGSQAFAGGRGENMRQDEDEMLRGVVGVSVAYLLEDCGGRQDLRDELWACRFGRRQDHASFHSPHLHALPAMLPQGTCWAPSLLAPHWAPPCRPANSQGLQAPVFCGVCLLSGELLLDD